MSINESNISSKSFTLCCLGHITHDKIITPKFTAHMPGGTAYYFAKALRSFDHDGFRLVTSVGPDDEHVVDELRADGLDVMLIPSRQSVYFENKYGEDVNHRTQRVLAKADPFLSDNLEDVRADVYHLGTLLADDFSLDVIRYLSQRGRVSVDVQGYLREVRGENVVHVDYADKLEALPHIDILKANETEMEVLTGLSDPHEAARQLAEWGVKEVLLTLGDRGSLIYAGGTFHEIPAYPPTEVIDATGCGDTYMAGYLYMRQKGASYREAGSFAAAMCTIKLAAKGPFNGTIDDVRRIIQTAESRR